MDQKEIQEKAMLYQMLQQQMNQLSEQANLIERKEAELILSKDALQNISKLKEGHEMLIPLGSEIFINAKVDNPKNAIVNAGAGIVVNKTASEAIEIIDSKMQEIERLKSQLEKNSKDLTTKMAQIVQEIEKAQKNK